MKKEVSQFRQRDLPSFFLLKTIRSHLIWALIGIPLIGYLQRDNIPLVLFFIVLGITFSLPAKRWTIQIIEICQKEGRRLNFEDVRATKPGKELLNYLRFFGGMYVVMFILGLVVPELYLGDIAAHHELMLSPPMSPRMYKLATFVSVFEMTLFYLIGGVIGGYTPIYLWVRKLPK